MSDQEITKAGKKIRRKFRTMWKLAVELSGDEDGWFDEREHRGLKAIVDLCEAIGPHFGVRLDARH